MMAGWLATPEKSRKSCNRCQQLSSPEAFGAGVRMVTQSNCSECIVMKCQPIGANSDILELYSMLPPQYDGMSGFKMFSWTDVKGIFELFRIPRKVWDDYYMRLLHFHERFVHYRGEYDKQHPMARATSKAPATAEEAVEQAMLDGK